MSDDWTPVELVHTRKDESLASVALGFVLLALLALLVICAPAIIGAIIGAVYKAAF